MLEAAQARRPLRMRPGNSRQALDENMMRTAKPSAAKPAHLHRDRHATALPQQIRLAGASSCCAAAMTGGRNRAKLEQLREIGT